MHDFNVQMNVIPKIEELAKKCIVLGGVAKVNDRCIV